MGFQFGYKDVDDADKDEKVHLKRWKEGKHQTHSVLEEQWTIWNEMSHLNYTLQQLACGSAVFLFAWWFK